MMESRQRKLAKVLGYLPKLERLPPKLLRPVYRLFDAGLGLKVASQVSHRDHLLKGDGFEYPIRIFQPKERALATVVYFHGGGCVIGDLGSHDRFCRYLSQHAQVQVIAVDYPLAPEHKFPQPVIGAINAWNALLANRARYGIQPMVGVAGDSAGAYLALLINLIAEQQALPVQAQQAADFQVLLYPMADLHTRSSSYEDNHSNRVLTTGLMDYFKQHFLPGACDDKQPLVSPVFSENLNQSPKTNVYTCGYDPLADGGKKLVENLEKAGVEVNYQHFADTMHGFISLAKVAPYTEQLCKKVCDDLKALIIDRKQPSA